MERTGRCAGAVLRAPLAARTWREVGYQVPALLLVPVGLLVIALLLLGIVLSLTLLGLPIVALVLRCARGLTRVHRSLARAALVVVVEEPSRRPGGGGPLRGLLGTLTDATAWGSVGFLLVQAPLAAVGAGAPVLLAAACVQLSQDFPGRAPDWLAVTSLLLVAVLGSPWVLRLCVRAQAVLLRALTVDPGRDAERLRRSRAAVLEGSAAEVRAIERNLHDGTQARLTAIALHLDMARSQLPGDPARAGELITIAHTTTREAISELRTIVRGIHPPALDAGLQPALLALAEQAGVEVHTDIHLEGARLSPAIETMAYFSVAELLSNTTKHAGAAQAWLHVHVRRRRLLLEVRDDGVGGADPAGGSGLRGLAQRIGAVDGALQVISPVGAGTSVRLDLPVRT